jgi:hypothetical protein
VYNKNKVLQILLLFNILTYCLMSIERILHYNILISNNNCIYNYLLLKKYYGMGNEKNAWKWKVRHENMWKCQGSP